MKIITLLSACVFSSVYMCAAQSVCSSSIITTSCVTIDVVEHGIQNPDLYHFLWDFGDGQKGEGRRVDHCYKNSGKYNSTLTLLNKQIGAYFSEELEIEVQIPIYFAITVNSPDTVKMASNFFFNMEILEGNLSQIDKIKRTINDLESDIENHNIEEFMSEGTNKLKVELLLKTGEVLCAEKEIIFSRI